jgi:hypothetical protein
MFRPKQEDDKQAKTYVERLLHSNTQAYWIDRLTGYDYDGFGEFCYRKDKDEQAASLKASPFGWQIYAKLKTISQGDSKDAESAKIVITDIESKCKDLAAINELQEDCRCRLF